MNMFYSHPSNASPPHQSIICSKRTMRIRFISCIIQPVSGLQSLASRVYVTVTFRIKALEVTRFQAWWSENKYCSSLWHISKLSATFTNMLYSTRYKMKRGLRLPARGVRWRQEDDSYKTRLHPWAPVSRHKIRHQRYAYWNKNANQSVQTQAQAQAQAQVQAQLKAVLLLLVTFASCNTQREEIPQSASAFWKHAHDD